MKAVKVALNLKQPFHKYHFNELNPKHVARLEQLKAEHPDIDISITQKEANEFTREFCSSLGRQDRALLFLDPYSTQLNWETLVHVAKTQRTDLWLLFPISALLRMTPKNESQIRPEWDEALTRLLGLSGWKDALYQPKTASGVIGDLFDDDPQEPELERINHEEVGRFVRSRLEEEFPFVADPIPLRSGKGSPLFLFFFAVSNPDHRAIGLAKRVINHILKQRG